MTHCSMQHVTGVSSIKQWISGAEVVSKRLDSSAVMHSVTQIKKEVHVSKHQAQKAVSPSLGACALVT